MSEPTTATIIVADDHPLFREALYQVAADALDGFRVLQVSDFEEAASQLQCDETVELVLLDLNMPGVTGFGGLAELRKLAPAVPVVIVSATDDQTVADRAIAMGAAGYLTKSLPRTEMTEALKKIMDGEVVLPDGLKPGPGMTTSNHAADPFASGGSTTGATRSAEPTEDELRVLEGIRELTSQQRRVLEMLVEGKSNKIIAYELDIAESTVKAHVSAILRKLRVHSRTQAVIKAGSLL